VGNHQTVDERGGGKGGHGRKSSLGQTTQLRGKKYGDKIKKGPIKKDLRTENKSEAEVGREKEEWGLNVTGGGRKSRGAPTMTEGTPKRASWVSAFEAGVLTA